MENRLKTKNPDRTFTLGVREGGTDNPIHNLELLCPVTVHFNFYYVTLFRYKTLSVIQFYYLFRLKTAY